MNHTPLTGDELIGILRLQRIPHIGDIIAKRLIAHCGSASAVFEEKRHRLLKIGGIGSHTLAHLWDAEYLEAAERELQYVRDHSIALSYFMDPDYPKYLKHCADGPILLFRKGNIDLENRKIISVSAPATSPPTEWRSARSS